MENIRSAWATFRMLTDNELPYQMNELNSMETGKLLPGRHKQSVPHSGTARGTSPLMRAMAVLVAGDSNDEMGEPEKQARQ